MTRLNLQFGNCEFRQSLLKGQPPRSIKEYGLKKFTFEHSDEEKAVCQVIGACHEAFKVFREDADAVSMKLILI